MLNTIVKILEQYYVMSLSEHQNQIIRNLTPEEVIQYQTTLTPEVEPFVPSAFSDLVKSKVEQLTKKKEVQKHENHKK